MLGAVSGLASWSKLRGSNDDDAVDRISHLWTVVLLVMFAVIVSSAQYVGDPIQCWSTSEVTGDRMEYAKAVCWVSNTYYIPMNQVIPVEIHERQRKEIPYYQWVPIIFMFMALLFKLPNIIWRTLNNGTGLNMEKLSTMAEKTQLGSLEDRDLTIRHISLYIDKWLRAHRSYKHGILVRLRQRLTGACCCPYSKRAGNYLTGWYMLVKLLYVANVFGQFFLLNAFLAMDFHLYGFQVIKHLGFENELLENPRFPRITLCDFEIRQLQNLQRWTIQCVLPINLFNEKIFIFLWFWLFLVATLTCFNYLSWLYHTLFTRDRVSFVTRIIKMNRALHTAEDRIICKKFVNDYLKEDGVFVLRVIRKNSNDLVVLDLVHHLWQNFRDNPCLVVKAKENGFAGRTKDSP